MVVDHLDAVVEVAGQHGAQDLKVTGEGRGGERTEEGMRRQQEKEKGGRIEKGDKTIAVEREVVRGCITLMMVAAPKGGLTMKTRRRMSG